MSLVIAVPIEGLADNAGWEYLNNHIPSKLKSLLQAFFGYRIVEIETNDHKLWLEIAAQISKAQGCEISSSPQLSDDVPDPVQG